MKRIVLVALVCTSCFHVQRESALIDVDETDLSQSIAQASKSIDEELKIPEQWWTLFNDEQLNHLIDSALDCNPTLHEASLRVDLAYAKAQETRAKLLPSLNAFGDAQREKLSLFGFGLPGFIPLLEPLDRNFNLITMLLQGSWEIDLWGKNRNLLKAQLDETTAAYAEWLQARLLIASSIATAYFSWQSHRKQLDVVEAHIADQSGVRKLMWQRFAKGMTGEFFVYQVDRTVSELEDAAAVLEGLIAIDREALAALVTNAAQLCDQKIAIDQEPTASYDDRFPLPKSLPLNLIARRPDIRAAIWRIEASTKRVKVAKARFYPNLDLLGNSGFISFFWDRLVQSQTFDYDVGGESILPIYTGGALQANLRQSKEELEIACSQYNQLVLQSVKEVGDALAELKTADQRLVDCDRALTDALALFSLTDQRYSHGIDTLVSFLNARSNVWVQELLCEEIHLARMEAIVALIRACGGGYCG